MNADLKGCLSLALVTADLCVCERERERELDQNIGRKMKIE